MNVSIENCIIFKILFFDFRIQQLFFYYSRPSMFIVERYSEIGTWYGFRFSGEMLEYFTSDP